MTGHIFFEKWSKKIWKPWVDSNPNYQLYWSNDEIRRWYEKQCETCDLHDIGVPPPVEIWTKDLWEAEYKKPYPENNTGIPMNVSGEEARKLVDDFANYCKTKDDTILANIGFDKKDDPMESRIAFCWFSLVNGRLLPHYGECLLHEFDNNSYMIDVTPFHILL